MLSLSKTKVSKEYIFSKKHSTPIYSLEEIIQKYKTSKNKIEEVTDFFIQNINCERIRFLIKMTSDKKYKPTVTQIEQTIKELILMAVDNFINNSIDSTYVSENIIATVSSYSGKHYLSISIRYDFTK